MATEAAPAAEPTATPPAPPETTEGTEPRTFTEEAVNRIVQERLARDRKDRPDDEEIAALRARAGKLDEIEQANATDLEKAQKLAADADKRAADAEAKITEATALADRTLVRAAVIAEAAKQGAVDPDAVHALLPDGKVTVEDGNVAGAEDAVKALLESKTYLTGQAPTSGAPGNGGARTPAPPADLDAQIAQAEKDGDHMLAISLKNRKLLAIRDAQAA